MGSVNCTCSKCNVPKCHKRMYSDKHDAYFCLVCDKWLEQSCNDSQCIFCYIRPEKPSMIKDKDEPN